MNTLYITTDEQKLYQALPAGLREGWLIETETCTAYESDRVLRIRAGMARFAGYPEMKQLFDSAMAKGSLDGIPLDALPEAILPELCFTIGARGITSFIDTLLRTAKSDTDVAGLAAFSSLRHDILLVNARNSST